MDAPYAFDFPKRCREPCSTTAEPLKKKNQAAWIPEAKAQLVVRDAPYPEDVGDEEIVVRNYAVGINPVDWKIQSNAGFGLEYPAVSGLFLKTLNLVN